MKGRYAAVEGRAAPTALAADDPLPMRAAEFDTDPVIEAYKRHIDRTLLRQHLRRPVTERVANLIALQRLAMEARRAGRATPSCPIAWTSRYSGAGVDVWIWRD